DCICVEERAFDIHLRTTAKNRITVFSHEPRNICRPSVFAYTRHHRFKTLRNLQQIWRRIRADIIERIKLKRKKTERNFRDLNIFQEEIHPRTVPGRVRPCEQLVFEVLQAWASDFQWRIEF